MDHPAERARALGGGACHLPAIRHRRVRPKNGAALRRCCTKSRGRPRRRGIAAGGPGLSLAKPMKRIAVVTSTPLFVEGGHLVMARALVQALRECGHEAELVLTPQNRFGRQGAAYLAAWLTDVGMSHNNRPIDQVISLRYPSYAVRHPNHVCWLNHTMREYYDQWDAFSAPLSWKGRIKEGARRRLLHWADHRSAHEERPEGVHDFRCREKPARALGWHSSRSAVSAAAAARLSLRGLRRLHFRGVAAGAAQTVVSADRGARAPGRRGHPVRDRRRRRGACGARARHRDARAARRASS